MPPHKKKKPKRDTKDQMTFWIGEEGKPVAREAFRKRGLPNVQVYLRGLLFRDAYKLGLDPFGRFNFLEKWAAKPESQDTILPDPLP